MAIYIEMPKLSDTMTEGTLVKWRKNEGDKIETGDVLAEVETDKATMEMEAFDDGILHKQLVAAGAKVTIGGRVALLLQKGEAPPADDTATNSGPAPVAHMAAKENAPESVKGEGAKSNAPAAAAPAPSAAPANGERVKSSPLARKIAQAKGVALASLRGTGPGGRIVAKDVEDGQPSAPAGAAAPTAAAPISATAAGEGDQRIPLSGMRRVIAERLLTSKSTIPHFYLNIEVDAGPLMKFRADANAASEAAGGPKLTVNDFVLKAIVAAAVQVPAVNASFAGDAIIQYAGVQLSVAIAVEEGLVTPVIRDAQKKTLREISALVKDLAARARAKKLKPEEYAGGTITVSNLGSYGIDSFSAIINPPQALIVSVGAIIKKPVVNAKDEIVIGQRLNLGLSADHRVVDGAVAAQFLAELRKLIESPALMLL